MLMSSATFHKRVVLILIDHSPRKMFGLTQPRKVGGLIEK